MRGQHSTQAKDELISAAAEELETLCMHIIVNETNNGLGCAKLGCRYCTVLQ